MRQTFLINVDSELGFSSGTIEHTLEENLPSVIASGAKEVKESALESERAVKALETIADHAPALERLAMIFEAGQGAEPHDQ